MKLKQKKYLIIDPKQVLAGKIMAQNIYPDDLVLTELGNGIRIILKHGIQIAKHLKSLTHEHEYELVFNSRLTEGEQIEILNNLNRACQEQGLEGFPEVSAMLVRDNIAYKDVDIKNSAIITNKDHGIWIAGFGLDSYGDNAAEQLEIISKLLEIKEIEKQNSIIINYSHAVIKTAELGGWKTYGSNSLSFKDNLKDLLESLELQEKHIDRKTELNSCTPDVTPGDLDTPLTRTESAEGARQLTEKESINDKTNIKANSLPSWQRPIVRRDHDFRNTGKKRLAGSSVSSGIFEEISTKKEWLGKADLHLEQKEKAEAFACKERIASDIYAFYGANTPRIELSKQRMTNTIPRFAKLEVVHTMSELIPGFKTYQNYCGKKFLSSSPNPNRQIRREDDQESLPERGLGQILAVAVLINDIDVIGGSGGNIGFQVMEEADVSKYAQTIKIDPGEAFTPSETTSIEEKRTIRVATAGTKERLFLHYDNLPQGTQQEFLLTVHKILQTTRPMFKGFFARPGAHHFTTYFNLTADFLIDFLAGRQAKLRAEYENDIKLLMNENPYLFPISEKMGEFEEVFNQEKAREGEIMASQEELYFYVDPDVLDDGRLVPLSAKIDEFIDFSPGNSSNTVILLKGDSGSGKSLSLRYLEQKLLNKRRNIKETPMPIYIDLKDYNKANVSKSFQNTLTAKYHDEYDPKNSCLVVLMDSYDEIAGGCQQNLYNIQQLRQYAQNIRVIITCRTQYLTTGYQQWFKPAGGTLKEYEIQPFNSQQINQYLQRYSEESIKVQKRSYTLEEYQQKISTLPNLKELITNPFILRLVAESLPQLEDYLKSMSQNKKQDETMREETTPREQQSETVVLNRYAIYKCFMDHWFAKQERKHIESGKIPLDRQVTKDFLDFSRMIALRLHSKKETEIKVKEDKFFKECFDDANTDMSIARSGCPLRRQNDYQYSFLHKSFLEYLVANGILEMIVGECSHLHAVINLSPELIISDQGVVTFLQDAYAIDRKIETKCLTRIYASRGNALETDPKFVEEQSSTADAANAITFLNAMNFNFSGLDLSNICIPHANLSHGTFEGTNFSEADLMNVNFSSAMLKDANFRRANLKRVNFGEWPYFQFEDAANCISISSNGNTVAAAMGSSIVIFERDIKTGKIRELKKIAAKSQHIVEYCKLNADGKHLLVSCRDDNAYIMEIATGDCLLKFGKSLKQEARNFDFSADGKQLVFITEDNSLRIWNAATGVFTHEFRGHESRITSCKFTPDGTQVISGSEDKTIRIWDVTSGLSTHKLAKKDFSRIGLNVSGANIEDVLELSETNLMLLHQRGARGFSDKERERFIENLNDFIGSQDQFSSKLDLSQKSLNDEIAWGIGKYTNWSNLEFLNLSYNSIGNKGALGLGANLTWTKLKRLDLTANKVEDEGAKGLAKNISWCNLQELDLKHNYIGDEGAQALSANTTWKKINIIYLQHNHVSNVPTHMRFLNEKYSKQLISERNSMSSQFEAEIYFMAKVQTLDEAFKSEVELFKDERREDFMSILRKRNSLKLNEEDLRREGFFTESQNEELYFIWIPNIQSLELTQSRITKETLVSFTQNLSAIHLNELVLAENEIENENLAVLGSNLKWKNLKRISIERNGMNDDGVRAFINSLKLSDLEELNLSKNLIGNAGAETISTNEALINLKKLILQDNNIHYEGTKALTESTAWNSLEMLDLSENSIGDKGANVIGLNVSWKNLKEMYLNECGIKDEGGRGLVKNSVWTEIQVLHLSNNEIGVNTITALANNEVWKNIKKFDLSTNSIDDECGVTIGTSFTWSNLTELCLADNNLGVKSAEALGSNTIWTRLRKLDIRSNKIPDEGGVAIGNNRTWIDLEELYISSNSLGDRSAEAIGTNTEWNKLKILDLSENKIGVEGGASIGKNQTWKDLKELNLSCNNIGVKGAMAIGENTAWVSLSKLSLRKNNIGEEGAKLLSKNTTWIQIHTFDLSHNKINDKGVEYLSSNNSWKNLQALYLQSNNISEKGAEYLIKNSSWINLETLDLSSNTVGDKGAESLASTVWTNLQLLNLSENRIGEIGAAALGSNKTWTQLKSLDLSINKIGEKSAEYLSKNSTWTALLTLNLSENQISDRGAEHLSKNTTWTRLQTLDLSDNPIGANGAAALGSNNTWTNFQNLNLAENLIREKGAESLGNNKSWTNLRSLNLFNNQILEKGGAYLNSNKIWTRLQTLNLKGNYIGQQGLTQLVKNTTWSHLQQLDLSNNMFEDQGVEYLSLNSNWSELRTLILQSCCIGDEEAESLSKNTAWINLRRLDLSDNNIGNKGAEYLSSNQVWTKLRTIILKSNNVGDKGFEYLRKNGAWTNLKIID